MAITKEQAEEIKKQLFLQLDNSKQENKEAVKEYYQIAPEIVQEINRKNNHPQEVWNSLYKEIKTAVDLVLSGDFNEAFKHYQEMTLNLKRTYLTKTKS